MEALARDHEPRAVAAIASRFNRVEPSHGQEAFASASTASPQLACRLAATPGHESGLTPDTNRHEKLGVSTQGSGARSWGAELFSFPVPHSCSLRGRRIRVRRNIPRAKRAAPAIARGVPHSCRGHQTQTEGRGGTETTCEGRLSELVSCVWGGVEELASGLQATAATRRLTRPSRASDAPRFVVARHSPVAKRSGCPTNEVRSLAKQGRKRPSANLSAHMEQYMWNRSDADMPSFHA